MANIIYNRGLLNLNNGTTVWDTNAIRVMLLANTYTPDKDHNVIADVSTHQVSGTGYTAGGALLANASITEDDTNDLVKYDADDVVWTGATITARYAVVYDDFTTSDPLICLIDFGADTTSTAADFTISWNDSGVLTIAQAA